MAADAIVNAASAARVALNQGILVSAENGVRAVIIASSQIYGAGLGVNPDSMQVPWLIDLARRGDTVCHIGPRPNVWSNVQFRDLAELYLLALEGAPAGAFFYSENEENAMRDI